ncbi:hypothetical protein FXN61_41130 [Lentzea sp. PSKA42]|uniref:Secreted protein n=1 Tax=Lentzea indica TaxID=2604800 RepID=A0ABX1FW19_9PSEU|nr:hypothetical protein [Lentzea indica]NKE62786.1 hypothetical protein [Lentzea indica]
MVGKAVRALLAAFAALVLTAGAAAPAMAQGSLERTFGASDEVSTKAVGWPNEVASVQTLYQCPGTHCNKGEARPGQELSEICVYPAGATTWALVYNRTNGHTGFIDKLKLIHRDPPTHCNDVGVGRSASGPLYQCMALFCNQGQATTGDHLRAECQILGADGWYWVWVFNRTNQHEGFFRQSTNADLQKC